MHIAFEYPAAFFLVVVLICFFRCKRENLKIYFAKLSLLSTSWKKKELLPLFTASLFILALASPFSYSSFAQNDKRGRDLVIAIDASGSMSGEFGDKSKFEVVKELVKQFLQKRFDDNVGVVVFGSFAYPASPITYDIKALFFILDYLEVSIAGNNTAIGEAIDEAVKLLKKGDAKKKAIVLFTDGYHNSGKISPKEAVARAKKIGAVIYTVGIGEEYDKKLLERIAKDTGGKSFGAKDPKALQEVLNQIDSLQASPLRSGVYLDKKPLFVFVLLLLVGLLGWQIRGAMR